MNGDSSVGLPDAIKQKVYPLFLQLFPESMAALASAIGQQNWPEARQLAHKMTGTLAALGAQSAANDLLQDLRLAIKEERGVAQIVAIHQQFTAAAELALQQVAAFLNK